ncbi:PIN domain-containing protein [Patescibacteria group bacterium]|nr:PIN domain-containing protein [Patescibacteria group bacterium]
MKNKPKNDTLKDKIRMSKGVVVDTNILIRALIDENAELSKLIANSDEVHIPLPIFFETVFVLEKFYKQPRETIIDYIFTIVSYENIFTDKNSLKEVLYTYERKQNLSIIDCFLLTYAKIYNLKVKTLDKALKKHLIN